MPMVDDFINDPERAAEFDKQMHDRIFKTGEEYAASNKRQKAENKKRNENRNAIKEMGISTHAYQIAIKVIKDLTPGERADWMRDFQMVVKVLGSKQAELFPEEALKAQQRADRAKEKAAGEPRSAADLDKKTDTDPKSDPKAGGAGQVDIEEAIAASQASTTDSSATFNDGAGKGTLEDREQAEGEAILAGKSEGWRGGYNAHAVGGQRGDNPFTEGSAQARDWFTGYEAATKAAFDAAQPAAGATEPAGETIPAAKAAPASNVTPIKPKAKPKSQSAKANEKREAAKLN